MSLTRSQRRARASQRFAALVRGARIEHYREARLFEQGRNIGAGAGDDAYRLARVDQYQRAVAPDDGHNIRVSRCPLIALGAERSSIDAYVGARQAQRASLLGKHRGKP